MKSERLSALLVELVAYPEEREWFDFKHNNCDPHDIGEYISAISNSAALHGVKTGYIIWGVEDVTRRIVGTSFKPRECKIGNEIIENWLSTQLTPRVNFRINEFIHGGEDIVIFEISRATYIPVQFRGIEYIRVASYKKKLKDYPEKERELWALFSREPFEKGVAKENVDPDEILSLLNYPKYFSLVEQPLPDNKSGILDRLRNEKLINLQPTGMFEITNLGAILFANDLANFNGLARKALRVIIYKGTNRVKTVREQTGHKGYASGFEGALKFIDEQLPKNEEIGQALRREVAMYPEIAIRELVANAIIHQDFTLTGTGPMAEIFDDRIEITNPGVPLIDTMRFIDEPPRSRNESLAGLMRRMNICEERGSGIDKVIQSVEVFQLPAPNFIVTSNHTKAILFAFKKLTGMDKDDRIRACYQHACLRYVSNDLMTNTTLRKRFSIEKKNYPMASRIISETQEAGLLKRNDPESTSRKLAKYVPFWA